MNTLEIRTVATTLRYLPDDVQDFDAEVNALLHRGWQLKNRCVLQGYRVGEKGYANRMLYAELTREVPLDD